MIRRTIACVGSLFWLVVVGCSAGRLWAHPIPTLDYYLAVKLDGTMVTDIGEVWIMDPIFSQELLTQFDANKDAIFDSVEAQTLEREVLNNLSEVRYFTYVSVQGQDVGPLQPQSFKVLVRDKIVIFAFGNPLPEAADVTRMPLTIQIKDDTLAVITRPAARHPVIFTGAPSAQCRFSIRRRQDTDSPFEADEVSVYCG